MSRFSKFSPKNCWHYSAYVAVVFIGDDVKRETFRKEHMPVLNHKNLTARQNIGSDFKFLWEVGRVGGNIESKKQFKMPTRESGRSAAARRGPPQKGMAICFVKGKYAGRTGWLDTSKKKLKGWANVIVAADDDEEEEEVEARIAGNAYRPEWQGEPATYEEAALRQHEDLEQTMIKLAEMWVSTGSSSEGVCAVFRRELDIAHAYLLSLGSRGRYRNVEFREEVPLLVPDEDAQDHAL